jgi:protein-arginine kinase activator protein McsA
MLTCEQCGNSIVEGGEFILKGKKNEPERMICQGCAAAAENAIESENRDIRSTNLKDSFLFIKEY